MEFHKDPWTAKQIQGSIKLIKLQCRFILPLVPFEDISPYDFHLQIYLGLGMQ